jgi:hypothetical protein
VGSGFSRLPGEQPASRSRSRPSRARTRRMAVATSSGGPCRGR